MQGLLRSIGAALFLALAAAAQAGDAKPPLVLDVRSEAEFAAGHVPGAVLIPHDVLDARIGELGEPREVIVYCRSGRRVELVRPSLEAAGFSVRALQGNFPAWQDAKLPVEQQESKEGSE